MEKEYDWPDDLYVNLEASERTETREYDFA